MYDDGMMDVQGETIIQGEEVPAPRAIPSSPRRGVPTPATPEQMGRRPRSHAPASYQRMSRRTVRYPDNMPPARMVRQATTVVEEDEESGPMLGQAVDIFDEMDAMDGRQQLGQRTRSATNYRRRM